MDSLSQHLDPKPIVIAERLKFHKAEQEESESIRQFLAKLQKLAETCEFGGYREEAIRDRFVCGLRVRSIQRKLLAEATLTLQTAVEKVCAAQTIVYNDGLFSCRHISMTLNTERQRIMQTPMRTPVCLGRLWKKQSRAQSFSGSLSAVGRREKLWDNGIFVPEIVGHRL